MKCNYIEIRLRLRGFHGSERFNSKSYLAIQDKNINGTFKQRKKSKRQTVHSYGWLVHTASRTVEHSGGNHEQRAERGILTSIVLTKLLLLGIGGWGWKLLGKSRYCYEIKVREFHIYISVRPPQYTRKLVATLFHICSVHCPKR